ncbi:MAG TPA: ImmA/IrrE family metallo-endopeptidase [Bacteroidetes bacterium]|nr:helix-turn-helix protein [bacterium BMS3Bbin04]HDO64448.1 ImmA/IrrE family metallo-endopeptidase [Bacteroidota bacterium]HEX03573.1 ImmA/IrrE family metallo-endopeptidase [Bacteroidota bacterium]
MDRQVIIARNIRARREELRLTQKDVAERSSLSVAGYRKIESGKVEEPRMATLTSIAVSLNLPLMTLFEEPRSLVSVRFRAQKKVRVRQRIIESMARWLEDYEYLEDVLDDHRPFKLAQVASQVSTYHGDDSKPVYAAKLAREAMELEEDEPILDVVGLLEWIGIKVRMMKYTNDGFFGLSGWGSSYNSPGVIVCDNNSISTERKIFSAVHEMGHLLLHRDEYDISHENEIKEHEDEANSFASHFLMPDSRFQEKWRELSGKSAYDRVMIIKRVFDVSYKTILMRLVEHGAVDYAEAQKYIYNNHRIKENRKLGSKTEPYAIGREYPFIARRLDNLVRQAVEGDLITVSRGAEILGMSNTDMRQVMQEWNWALAG